MRTVKISILSAGLAAAALTGAVFCTNAAPVPASALQTVTPPPTPPPIGAPNPSPQPNATLIPLTGPSPALGSPHPSGTATPSPPPVETRKGVEGVWEVAIQRADRTDYTHLLLTQSGGTLTGTYLDASGKKYPLAGSIDGKQVRIVVSMPDGTSLLLEGHLDGTTDMVGMFTTPKDQTPFSAAYRAKEKWIDNINAAPGGLGGGGIGGGGSPGGYTPPR
jgi:hypothetical protein